VAIPPTRYNASYLYLLVGEHIAMTQRITSTLSGL